MADSMTGAPADRFRAQASHPVSDGTEVVLGRAVAIAVPAVSVLMALIVGLSVGLGPALLILAGGGIVGTISLLWASVRTLSGDAPLSEALAGASEAPTAVAGGAAERKRAALRAIKDLELELSVGKIDQEDYDVLVARYRDEAKDVMREMDVPIEPFRERAEAIAREHLEKVGLAKEAAASSGNEEDDDGEDDDDESAEVSRDAAAPEVARTPLVLEPRSPAKVPVARVACARCDASNEADADFCKKCGAALHKGCPSCHASNEADADFCKKCGTKLTGSVKDTPDASA